jgi:osmotically-inducible protein OsmY
MKIKSVTLGLVICLSTCTAVTTLVGCAGNRYEQSTGEHIDDTATTARVKKALHEDPQYKYDQVDVKTFKGTTQLSGFVDNRDQRSRAMEIARNVEGVKVIQNNISVKQ